MKSTKVADKYVRETIDEYNRSIAHIPDNHQSTPTTVINGMTYLVVNMSYEEFLKEKNGIDMEDIKWT